MKEQYKEFFCTLITYFAGNVFTKMISFLLLPLYTKLIDPVVYGVYGVNSTIMQLVVPIVYMNIWDSFFRYAMDSKEKKDRYGVISIGFCVLWVSSLVCIIVYFGINCIWNFGNLTFVIACAIANAFQYFYGYVARSMSDSKIFIVSGCINTAINLVLNYLGIVYLNHGIETLYYSYIIGTFVQVIVIENKYHVVTNFKWNYVKKDKLHSLLNFGIPLALNSVMQWLLLGLTQIVIAYKLGTYYNGLFSVAIKFATLTSLVASIFEYAWIELAYKIANNGKSDIYYYKALNMLFVLMIFGMSMLMLGIKIIYPYYINDSYHESLYVIPLITSFATTNSIASFTSTIYRAYKDVNWITISSLIAGISNFLLLIIFIHYMGFYGAVLSLACASAVMMVIRLILLGKKYSIYLDMSTISCLLLMPASFLVFYFSKRNIIDIVVILIWIIIFLITIYYMWRKYILGIVKSSIMDKECMGK